MQTSTGDSVMTSKLGLFLAPVALLCATVPQTSAFAQDGAHGALYAAATSAEGRPEAMVELDQYRRPAEILAFFGVEPGDNILEVGMGAGYWVDMLARVAGDEGLVIGSVPEVAYEAREQVRDATNAAGERNANFRADIGSIQEINYPAASLDFVMLSLIFHDVYFVSSDFGFVRQTPQMFLAGIYEALRPGGTVGVIDSVAPAGMAARESVEALHRIDPAVIRRDFEAAGFVLEEESDLLRNPEDDHTVSAFDPSIRHRTDKVVMRFRRP